LQADIVFPGDILLVKSLSIGNPSVKISLLKDFCQQRFLFPLTIYGLTYVDRISFYPTPNLIKINGFTLLMAQKQHLL